MEFKLDFDSLDIRSNANNIVFRFIFLVKDLKSLLRKLEDLNVNAGVQSLRAELNLRQHNLSLFDRGFRNSLLYNVQEFAPTVERKNFNFKNIHVNLGHVRSYSTLYKNELSLSKISQILKSPGMVVYNGNNNNIIIYKAYLGTTLI